MDIQGLAASHSVPDVFTMPEIDDFGDVVGSPCAIVHIRSHHWKKKNAKPAKTFKAAQEVEGDRAKSESGLESEKLVDDNVVRSNPTDPSEVTQSNKESTRKPVPEKGSA
ncbi:hypothetical protein KC333_g197 [Hortaea werneckii]|nr:hypothetical protein KC333_g197 [Hortaea werneckii]